MATLNELRKTVKGLVMPIPAVFDGKGEPDLPMIEKLTDWYLDNGVHGFFVLGSQGQGPACRIDQRKAVAETVVRRVNHRVPSLSRSGRWNHTRALNLGFMPNSSARTLLASSVPTITATATSGN